MTRLLLRIYIARSASPVTCAINNLARESSGGPLSNTALRFCLLCNRCRNSSNMVVPTLPVLGVAPPFEVFQAMNGIAIALVYVLIFPAFVSTLVNFRPLQTLILFLCCIRQSRRTPKQRGLDNCRRCMNSLFLFVGRWLCVQAFPALFKMHKTRSDQGGQTRKFMVFLDRRVETSVPIIAAFCSIVCCILYTSTAVFIRYFPVEVSAECLETDNHGRTLFCYSNSSLPVDCVNFSMTELRELQFQCYAIALPVGLGIAVAAALALAKMAIVGVTIFVKVLEGFFTMTKNPQKLSHCCCCCCRLRCANKICVHLSRVLLVIVSLTSLICCSIIVYLFTIDWEDLSHFLHYYAYPSLPVLICAPLACIVLNLEAHCSRGEYISFAAEQRPPDPRDWDVESGASVKAGQHHIATSMQRESGNINDVLDEKEGALLIEVRENTEFTEDGATQL